VPNQPKTPKRTFRVSDDLYKRVQEKAKREGRTVSDIVNESFENYLEADEE
jgi:predicted DNA-binding protein